MNNLPPLSTNAASLNGSSSSTSSKLNASAKEFESVLLTQWLQAAESSFGSVPGADDDQDGGGEQLKSFGVQQLATALTNAGGIGIAKLVSKALTHADSSAHTAATPEISSLSRSPSL